VERHGVTSTAAPVLPKLIPIWPSSTGPSKGAGGNAPLIPLSSHPPSSPPFHSLHVRRARRHRCGRIDLPGQLERAP
ncbi:hypothetical protein KUCAC02_000448, partial [Chaenocephalus aceratus]